MTARCWAHCRDCDCVFSVGHGLTECSARSIRNGGEHTTEKLEACTGCPDAPPQKHAAWCPKQEPSRERDDAVAMSRKALLSVEWTRNDGGTFTCLGCARPWDIQRTHTDDCLVDKALTALGLDTREERDKALAKVVKR